MQEKAVFLRKSVVCDQFYDVYLSCQRLCSMYGICREFRRKMGNFYEDVIRVTTRILIPFSFVIGLLVSQGVPQTLQANETIQTIEGKMQDLQFDR